MPDTKGRTLEGISFHFAEITGDYSILEADRKKYTGRSCETFKKGPTQS
jgi:hypothetical protein